jgi:hypothetical protein
MGRGRGRNRRATAQKRPRTKVAIPTGKQPRLPAREVPDDRPSWRFADCDNDGEWAWDWQAFLNHFDTLMAMEGTAWGQLGKTGTIGSAKHIPLANLCRDAQTRLERLGLDDADALWELRLGGKPRLWGRRLGHCLHFLWWDPEHTVCPSTKR